MAHSFMAWATTLATSMSRGSPSRTVLSIFLYVTLGRRSFITLRLKTLVP